MEKRVLFVHDGPIYTNENDEVFGIHYTEEIKQRYLQLGNSVTFCMRGEKIKNSEDYKYSRIQNENFKFVSFPNFKSINTYLRNKPKAKRIITDLVKDHDVLVVRMPSASGSIAIKAARKYKTPYLVEMVACTYDAYRFYNWKGRLIAFYKLQKVRNIIKDCTHVLYVTKHFLQERYPTKGISIHCSDVKLNTIPEEILQHRLAKIDNTLGSIVLGSIGVIDVEYKGQADVIMALHKLKSKNLTFKYRIVGQGNPNRLQLLIDKLDMVKEVEIVGSLPSDRINDFLQTIDLYIQPSKTEGLPRAVIEAMSMGCPAAGSNVGGIPELLNSDCLFEPGSVEDIVDTILSFTPEKLEQEARRNFDFAKRYQIDNLKQRREEFYKTFLKDFNLQ